MRLRNQIINYDSDCDWFPDDSEEEYEQSNDSEENSEENSEEVSEPLSDNSNEDISPIVFLINKKRKKKSKESPETKKYKDITENYNKKELEFFNNLENTEKDNIYNKEIEIKNTKYDTKEPLRFQYLNLDIPKYIKQIVISNLNILNNTEPSSGEYFKLSNWINNFSKVPIGKYHTLPIKNTDEGIAHFLQNIKQIFDASIFGHDETKEQIIRILAQWISNPNSNGYVIGIQGSPGVGKTKLIKEGVAKALGYPFAFISLGGVSDASFLQGHNYTYEGSSYGKIVECLMKTNVMNPVILFDELDKVSSTVKGDEIINTLINITDPVQNDRFTDKYFEEINLDLSKALMFFTYNDESLINPILKDRMITIKVNGYSFKEKMTICKNYIIPELLPQYNLHMEDIQFEESLIKLIIDSYGKDEGVRNIKRVINNILSYVNMMRYIPNESYEIKLPFSITIDFFEKFCKKEQVSKTTDILLSMYT